MAKIIYDKDPIDPNKRVLKNYEGKTIDEILDDLKVYESCSVEINGVIPDECDLKYIPKEDDIIRIRKPLHGSSEESGKLIQTIGTIVGIIVSLIPGGQPFGAAIIAASNLVGGLIIANSVKPPKLQERAEGEQAAQVFNLTAAQNEVRKIEPMMLTMGSHRLAPDFASQPYQFFSAPNVTDTITRTLRTFQTVNDTFTTTLPAGWLSDNNMDEYGYVSGAIDPDTENWWPHPIRVQSGFNAANWNAQFNRSFSVTNFIGNNQFVTTTVNDYVTFNTNYSTTYSTPSGNVVGNGPILIEHFDPADPVVINNGGQPYISTLNALVWGYFSMFKFDRIDKRFEGGANGSTAVPGDLRNPYMYYIGALPGPLNPASYDSSFFFGGPGVTAYSNLYQQKDAIGIGYYQPTDDSSSWFTILTEGGNDQNIDQYPTNYNAASFVFDDFDASGTDWDGLNLLQRRSQVLNFFEAMNDTQTTDPNIPGNFEVTEQVAQEPNPQQVRHIFHYGFGDLDITDERVGDTNISRIFGEERLRNTENQTNWPIDQNEFHSNVKVVEGADLQNNDTFKGPVFGGSTSSSSTINWVTRETPENTFKIQINIEGRSFESLDDGSFALYGADFEIQIRTISSPTDTGPFTVLDPALFIGSNIPDPLRETVNINLAPNKYEIRIRKKTKDPTDNKFIQEFKCTGMNFFVQDTNPYLAENREGLKLEATGTFNGNTRKYNALVEASCYYFDRNTQSWVWGKHRNPAFWFLYYSKGGFLNETSNGSGTYPFSPTIGWQNNADDPGNLERIFGAGLSDVDIDLDKILEWGAFCEDNFLFCDLVIRADASVHDTLQRIANTGRASVTYYCSKLSIVFEDPLEPVTGMFGMSNILKGSFAINYAVEDIPYKVVGKFTDRNDEYKTNEVEAIIPNSVVDNLNIEEVVLDGITDEDRAQREVNILAARQAYQRRRYSWSTAIEGVTVKRGDKVYLSHDVTCYDQSGRIYGATVTNGAVTELETNVCLGTTTSVMIRFLDGTIQSFNATADGTKIILENPIALNLFPSTLNQEGLDNPATDYPQSVIEDLIFFAGPKATPGKAVRILSVEPQDGLNKFKINAVEEDAVIWAFEFDNTATPEEESFERVVASIKSADFEILEDGKVKIQWQLDGADHAIIRQNIGGSTVTLQSEGQYTQFKNYAILDLPPGGLYNLEIVPITFGTVYDTVTYPLTVRT